MTDQEWAKLIASEFELSTADAKDVLKVMISYCKLKQEIKEKK